MLTESQVSEFWNQGFLVLRGWSVPRASLLRQGLDQILEKPYWGELHYGRRFGDQRLAASHRFAGLSKASPQFSLHAQDLDLRGDVEKLVGAVSVFRDVLLSKPAHTGGSLSPHQDLAYWDLPHDRVVTAWFALTPARSDSGALVIWPGTHRHTIEHQVIVQGEALPSSISRMLRLAVSLTGTGDAPKSRSQRSWASLKEAVLEHLTRTWPTLSTLGDLQIPPDQLRRTESLVVEAEPGDLILFHGRTVHGSAENRSDRRRDAYLVTYLGAP